MAITKSDVGWLVDIQPGGRGHKRFRKTFETKREALEWETWIKGQVQQVPDWQPKVKRDSRRLSDLIELWWVHHGRELRAGRNTRQRLDNLVAAIGNPLASQFSSSDFTTYRAQRLDAGISANAINREQSYLRAVFNELIRLELWSEENPLSKVRPFSVAERELVFLTLSECKRLLASLAKSTNPDVLDVAKVCLATGARWSEAEGLLSSQLRPGAIEFARTKSGKVRAVPITDTVLIMLEGRAHLQSGRLFISCYSAFREGLERSEIELPAGQLTHVLRHTFASHFMMNGGNILALQRILGHSDLKMTMRYAHLAPEHLNEVRALNPLSRLTIG